MSRGQASFLNEFLIVGCCFKDAPVAAAAIFFLLVECVPGSKMLKRTSQLPRFLLVWMICFSCQPVGRQATGITELLNYIRTTAHNPLSRIAEDKKERQKERQKIGVRRRDEAMPDPDL